MFLLVSLSKSKFFTRFALVSLVQHSFRTCVVLVLLVSHSCCTRVASVALLCIRVTRVARVWHSCCKLDQIHNDDNSLSEIFKPNWLELHLKQCSFLTNGNCGTILIGDSILAGLRRYQNIWNENFSFNTLNCVIGGDKVQNVLWQAQNLPTVKSIRNVVILCGTNDLHLDAPEDIADGIIEIGSTFKRLYTNVNVFICGILPSDCYWSINQVYIKDVNKNLKLMCVGSQFSYIGRDTNQTLANGSLNPELFYCDKIHLVEKGNSKLSKSIRKSIEDFYDTENINRYQLTKSLKMAVSFVLSNADFPPLYTVSKIDKCKRQFRR